MFNIYQTFLNGILIPGELTVFGMNSENQNHDCCTSMHIALLIYIRHITLDFVNAKNQTRNVSNG